MEQIIITTTNTIEGATVEKYLGVITSNLVVGTNFISDFVASFSDFFGGMSGTYREKMDLLYNEATTIIINKAKRIGANAIIGFRIDFDEISGKGKSMFMIAVSGTAVKINMTDKLLDNSQYSCNSVSLRKYKINEFLKKWNYDISVQPTAKQWEFIFDNNLTELLSSLYEKYCFSLRTLRTSEECSMLLENFSKILSNTEYSKACDILYKNYEKHYAYALPLIKKYNLFNTSKIIDLLKNSNNINIACDLFNVEKSEYSREDLLEMKEIVNIINRLPDIGHFEDIKSGVFSAKTKRKYICPNGHKNNEDILFCLECGKNIKGLYQKNVEEFDKLKEKIEILSEMLE